MNPAVIVLAILLPFLIVGAITAYRMGRLGHFVRVPPKGWDEYWYADGIGIPWAAIERLRKAEPGDLVYIPPRVTVKFGPPQKGIMYWSSGHPK